MTRRGGACQAERMITILMLLLVLCVFIVSPPLALLVLIIWSLVAAFPIGCAIIAAVVVISLLYVAIFED